MSQDQCGLMVQKESAESVKQCFCMFFHRKKSDYPFCELLLFTIDLDHIKKHRFKNNMNFDHRMDCSYMNAIVCI